jgi:hypothetical protein
MIEGLKVIHGSYGKAARECGIPEGTMTKLRRGERPNPRISTIEQLASGFPEPLSVVLARYAVPNGTSADRQRSS